MTENTNKITHNIYGTLDNLVERTGPHGAFAKARLVRASQKAGQRTIYVKMSGKALEAYKAGIADGSLAGKVLDFGGYFVADGTFQKQDGSTGNRTALLVKHVAVAKTRQEIRALASAKKAREAAAA